MIGVDPADVLVVPGGQAGLSTALRALLPPGAQVVVESPTYLGLLTLARSARLRPVPVPSDADGLRPDLLAEALARSGARLVCCQPTFTNPTGALWPPQRRREVLEVVRSAGAFLLEDDFARLLPMTAEPPPPLVRDDPDGHVVYLTSLSKPAAPSLRIGALVARGPVAARLRARRAVDDFFVSAPLQEAAVELVTSGAWRRHLARLRLALTARRDALVGALAAADLPARVTRIPHGGLHLWLRLADGVDDRELARRCARRGLLIGPGTPYHASEPPAPFLRLTFAGEPEDRLAAGVRLLAEAMAGARPSD
jgi:DNA-binding transcriptional MocR family regulator